VHSGQLDLPAIAAINILLNS